MVDTVQPLLEAYAVSKSYRSVKALENVSLQVLPGRVTCLLGDNGAGKSSLIKILSGVNAPDSGTVRLDGKDVRFRSAADALDRGIATVFQHLAVFPLMPVYRNFFIRREPTRGRGPFRRMDVKLARQIAAEELRSFGIDVDDVDRPIVTLSGGETQCVAIARAVHFGAKVLILDEPTSALGVKEAAFVLRFISAARARGVGIVFITHNVTHAFPLGDIFVLLDHGRMIGTYNKHELELDELTKLMAGGSDIGSADTALEDKFED
jgi:simple sugar transport system ATP-binding protein